MNASLTLFRAESLALSFRGLTLGRFRYIHVRGWGFGPRILIVRITIRLISYIKGVKKKPQLFFLCILNQFSMIYYHKEEFTYHLT